MVAIAMVNAEGEDDVNWWTVEWRDVLSAMAMKEPMPTPPSYCIFEVMKAKRKEDKVEVKSGKEPVKESLRVPYQVSDIMWIENIHGKRYQEMFSCS